MNNTPCSIEAEESLLGAMLQNSHEDPAKRGQYKVFALNDDMKPRMYGDMEEFAEKLRKMGYQEVRIIDTAREAFGSHRRAALMMLGDSRMLAGRK